VLAGARSPSRFPSCGASAASTPCAAWRCSRSWSWCGRAAEPLVLPGRPADRGLPPVGLEPGRGEL